MKNLLQETLDEFSFHGKTVDDIDWIGSKDYVIPTDFFFKIIDVDYDDGYGSQDVAYDLMIVFKDGTWLERAEYDGSEWWTYRCAPEKPNKSYTLPFVTSSACEEYLSKYEFDIFVPTTTLSGFVKEVKDMEEKISS